MSGPNVSKLNIALRLDIAVKMAVALRDKLDFSSPKNYDDLADYAFLAADALLVRADKLQAEAVSKDEAEEAARVAAQEKALKEAAAAREAQK